MKAVRKIRKFTQDLDIYGQQVQFNYKGKSTYQTGVGGFFTILTYLFIVYSLATSFIELANNENTVYVYTNEINLLTQARNLTFQENELEMASRLVWNDEEGYYNDKDMRKYQRILFISREYLSVNGVYTRVSNKKLSFSLNLKEINVATQEFQFQKAIQIRLSYMTLSVTLGKKHQASKYQELQLPLYLRVIPSGSMIVTPLLKTLKKNALLTKK